MVIAPFTSDEWGAWAEQTRQSFGITNDEIKMFLGINRASDWKLSLIEASELIKKSYEAREKAFKDVAGEDEPESPIDPGNTPLDPDMPVNLGGTVGTQIDIGGFGITVEAAEGDTPAHILARLDILSAALKAIKVKHPDMKPYQAAAVSPAPAAAAKEEVPTTTREYYGFKRFVDGTEKTITLPYIHELSGKESEYPDTVSKQGHRLFDKALEEAGLKLLDYEHGKLVKMKIVGTWKQGGIMPKAKPEDKDQYYRTWLGFTITPS